MAVVETRDLTKQFDGVKAVDSVSLVSTDGEFLVLLGPSGCGKTTLLRMIGGLEAPTAGEIVIGGENVTNLPPRARQIAMVFQSYALYPHMTVYNNIAFPLKAQRMPKAAQQERVAWAARILGIDHLMERRPRQLSGGQRQRVALARALVREPNVFLLDEPLSNLDAQRRASARDELQQFQRRVATTTIYVTHDQVEAMGMGDRIAVMESGRIRQLGTPGDIYDQPADVFVATFVGSPPMNLVPTVDGISLLGFRPEQFFRHNGKTDDGVVTFPFHVHREEYLGAERLYYGEIGESKVIARFPVTDTTIAPPGGTYEFAVYRRNLRQFDRITGERTDNEGPR